jgi:HD-GYP domain-containing protein (c-di-GMP phosphodiesterase class II)
MHPSIASNWLAHIPRLEEVAEIIAYQNKGFDGSGSPLDTRQGDQLPLGSRILRVVLDFDLLTSRNCSWGTALSRLKEDRAPYDPLVLKSLEKVLGVEAAFDRKNLMLPELREKMILAEDLYTIENPKKLIAKDYELSGTIIETLKKYDSAYGLKQPIQVLVPLAKNSSL